MSMLLVVAGPAGSGKTTLADALAEQQGAPHLDFDDETAALVDAQRSVGIDATEADLLLRIKAERYLVFAQSVSQALHTAPLVIASAPFTSHVRSPEDWDSWVGLLPSSTEVVLAWLVIDPRLRLERMRERGSSRDAALVESGAAPAVDLPLVPHLPVSADAPLEASVALVTGCIR